MKRILLLLLLPLLILAGGVEQKAAADMEQSINLSTIANARELGGYKTMDGKTVCEGVLLRTAVLTDASQEELDYLIHHHKLAAVIDLRA